MNKDHMKLGIAILEEYRDAKKKLVMTRWYTRVERTHMRFRNVCHRVHDHASQDPRLWGSDRVPG